MKLSDEIAELWEELLMQLPLPVRDAIRTRAEALAEAKAEDNGGALTPELGARAFLEATPADLRANLGKALNAHGYDLADFDDLGEE